MFIAISVAPLVHHDHGSGFHDLKILQHGPLILHFVQSKDPGHSTIIQTKHPTHRGPPLRLAPQEHLKHRPVFLQHLAVARRLQLRHVNAKHRSIIRGLVLCAAASPMLGGLDQFFRLAPLMLSMYALRIATASSGTSSSSDNAFSL